MFDSYITDILYALDWLCAWLLEETAAQCDALTKSGQSAFDVRNNSQTFYAAKLAIVYGEVRPHSNQTVLPPS